MQPQLLERTIVVGGQAPLEQQDSLGIIFRHIK